MRVLSSPWLRLLPVVLSATTFLPANAEQMPVRQRIAFPDVRLEVFGLPWFSEDKPALRRLPLRLKDLSFALANAGRSKPAKMAMMAITTNNSMSVNALIAYLL